ncbi:WD40 repeat-like protein [Obba rivulosa]|uniref:WD40 repeat-like protein n=1 Tax=Obba rivulosa TaxID=1052685 RepID=A0A8E2AME5_9APHY|nr:WD40 repeat-like protein [Obba rivulosa]
MGLHQEYSGRRAAQRAFVQKGMSTVLDDLHTDIVHSLAFSPDGSIIGSASGDGSLQLLGANDRETKALISGFGGPIRSIAFSPDGSRFATGSDDRVVRIWDTATATAVLQLKGHLARINEVVFSPDGSFVGSASDDGTVRLWNLETGEATLVWEKDMDQACISLAFPPPGSHVMVGTDQGTIYLVDCKSGAATPFFSDEFRGPISSIAITPTDSWVAAAHPRVVLLWKSFTPTTPPITLEGHTERVCCVAFAPDGFHLVSGSFDRTVRVWNAETCEVICVLQDHTTDVRSVAISPLWSYIVSGNEAGTIRSWDTVVADVQVDMDFAFPSPTESEAAFSDWDESEKSADFDTEEIHAFEHTAIADIERKDLGNLLPTLASTDLGVFMSTREKISEDIACTSERFPMGLVYGKRAVEQLSVLRESMRRRFLARRQRRHAAQDSSPLDAPRPIQTPGHLPGDVRDLHPRDARKSSFAHAHVSYGEARMLVGVVPAEEDDTTMWCCC